MGNRINHDTRNKARKMVENGFEDIVTGKISDGIGTGKSPVFDKPAVGRTPTATTRIVKQPTGVKRIRPGSPEWEDAARRHGIKAGQSRTNDANMPLEPPKRQAQRPPSKDTLPLTTRRDRLEAASIFRNLAKKKKNNKTVNGGLGRVAKAPPPARAAHGPVDTDGGVVAPKGLIDNNASPGRPLSASKRAQLRKYIASLLSARSTKG